MVELTRCRILLTYTSPYEDDSVCTPHRLVGFVCDEGRPPSLTALDHINHDEVDQPLVFQWISLIFAVRERGCGKIDKVYDISYNSARISV